ncbi:MAG: hypothetical protein IIX25_01500, partial [Clostridia bacterium]|nr:hypothetical protein [Clostridia bacterium]
RTVEDAGPYNHNIKFATKSVGDDVLVVRAKRKDTFINDELTLIVRRELPKFLYIKMQTRFL